MTHTDLETQLRRLMVGLADQDIKVGQGFRYDGGALMADDVAEIGYASILCLAQHLAERLGMESFGYEFTVGDANPVFPLHVKASGQAKAFLCVAPFVQDVFFNEVRECRHDLALVFERAMRTLDPAFELATHTTYDVAAAMNRTTAFDLHQPGLGR